VSTRPGSTPASASSGSIAYPLPVVSGLDPRRGDAHAVAAGLGEDLGRAGDVQRLHAGEGDDDDLAHHRSVAHRRSGGKA
jgi:hypothetical protein